VIIPLDQLETQNTPGRFGGVLLVYTALVPEEYRGIVLLRWIVTHAQPEIPGLRTFIHVHKQNNTKEEPLDVNPSGFYKCVHKRPGWQSTTLMKLERTVGEMEDGTGNV
jgi:hypothetical protein